MDSQKIKDLADAKLAARQRKEQKKRERLKRNIDRANKTVNRVSIVQNEDGETLHIRQRPFKSYFNNFQVAIFWAIYITLIMLHVLAIAFLFKIFTKLFSNHFVAFALSFFIEFYTCVGIFFIIIKIIRPPLHLRVTRDGFFALIGHNSEKPIAAGRTSELRVSAFKEYSNGWTTVTLYLSQKVKKLERINHKDHDSIVSFLQRHSIEH